MDDIEFPRTIATSKWLQKNEKYAKYCSNLHKKTITFSFNLNINYYFVGF